MQYGLQKKSSKLFYLTLHLFGLSILALVAMQVGTQFIAYKLNYQRGLGKYLLTINNIPIYPFTRIFEWKFSNVVELLNLGKTIAFTIFTIPQFAVYSFIFWKRRTSGNKDLHGSARFADEDEIELVGLLNGEGVYVGAWQKKSNSELKYLRHNGPEHIISYAPTRAGKGVGLIIPTLLSWLHSTIILDIKGENWALTSGYRKLIGHKVLKFDPTDVTGNSCKFNPIEEVRLDTLYAIQDVQNLALMIVDADGKGLPDHWTKAAFAFFSGIILHCCVMIQAKEKRSATLYDVTLMLSGFGYEKGVKSLLEEMKETNHFEELKKVFLNIEEKIGKEIHAFVASTALEMSAKADTEASGVVSSALVNMALYKDPIIAMNTSSCDFRLNDLMNHESPVDLYLVLSPASIDRVRPLIRLIADMIIRHVCKEMTFKDGTSVKGYKHRLLLMLDEFTSLGKLPIIEKSIAYIAGYGGKMYLIVQDITQLNAVYGKDNAIMANCHIRIAYAPNSIETTKVLSEMTGKTTVVDNKISTSYSQAGASRSHSVAETARPLLTPDECMRLPSAEKDSNGNVLKGGDMLIFVAYGKQILYFKDPIFMERVKIEAPQVSDSLYRNVKVIEPKRIEIPQVNFEKYLEEE